MAQSRNGERSGLHPLAYMGVEPKTPPSLILRTTTPSAYNNENFNIGTIWINTSTNAIYMLTNLDTGTATWNNISSEETFNADTGSCTSVTHEMSVIGSGILETTATGSTLTIGTTTSTDGQIPIGDTGGTPAWATILSAGGTVAITNTANAINLEVGGTAAASFVTDAGTAVPAVGAINVLGGTNINTAGTGSTVTIHLDDPVTVGTINATTFDTNVVAAGVTLAGTSLLADGTDTDISINITAKGTGQVIIDDLQLTTDLAVSEGGSGASTFTDHGLLVGSGAAAFTALAEGATGEFLIGNTGGDPSWTNSPTFTTINATTVNATTFDTNVAAAAVTLSGTSLLADGTDTDIDINITAKGTGQVIIDDLQLTTDLAVEYGGTGAGTFTDHGVLLGSGTGAITALGVATNGQLVVGSTGADPVVATVGSTDGSLTITGGAGTLVIEGTDATETQDGVVELATDAEAVAGTDTVRAIVPTSLKAKLGTQTDHGVLVGSGDTAAITALGVATNGQLIVGSTGADPVIATVGSTDGSLTVTGGAGTLVIEGTDATETQDGVVELATDAESIAGTDTVRAIVPTSLKAKLGTQTDHGVLIGSGDTAAITAAAVGTDGQLLIGASAADPAFATMTSSSDVLLFGAGTNTLEIQPSGALQTCSGFESWGGAGNYYDDTVLGSFELLRQGTGYIKGVAVAWAGSQTVTGMTAGNTYLIYIDDTGTIGKTTSFSVATFQDNIVLFECLRDSTTGTNIQYTVKENHPYNFCQTISHYLHETLGTLIENHQEGANITLNGTQKIEIVGDDELTDHGLYTDIPDSSAAAVSFNQMFTDGSGKWATYQTSDTFAGYWNSAGTATAPSGTKYSAYVLYVCKDDLTTSTPTYWAVLNDSEYNNLAAAQAAGINNEFSVSTNELSRLEMAQLGYIIYKQSTSEIIDVVIEKSTAGASVSGGGGSSQANLISTDVANFDGILSSSDTTVQAALETIDEWSKWNEVTGTTQAMAVSTGYIANNGSPVVFTLPSTAEVGKVIRVSGLGAGGWKIEQNASQEITFGIRTTTNGVTGYLESTQVNDTVELLCTVTDTTFNVISSVGNITFA